MRLVMHVSYLLMQFFAIAFALAVQGSAGYNVAPAPEMPIVFPPIHVRSPGISPKSNEQTPESQPYVSHPPIAVPPPHSFKGLEPSLSPSSPTVFAPYISAPPSSIVQKDAPLLPPSIPQRKSNAPVASPLKSSPVNSPTAHPVMSEPWAPTYDPPILEPIAPGAVPVALPPGKLVQNPPAIQPVMPVKTPPLIPVSPTSGPPPLNTIWKMPVAAPPHENSTPLSPYPQSKGSFPAVPPSTHKNVTPSNNAPLAPVAKSFPKNSFQHPASSPLSSFYKNHHQRNNSNGHAPKKAPATSPERSLAPLHPPERHHASPPYNEGSSYPSPDSSKGHGTLPPSPERHHASPPFNEGSSYPSPDSSKGHVTLPPSPSPTHRSRNVHVMYPGVSPSGSTRIKSKTPPPLTPVLALPPPPPNEDCRPIACTEPLTYTAPGSPCGCVWPMKVGLRFSASLLNVFPLVSELAQEIASGVFVKQSQVRITGATASTQEPEKSVVLIDIIPLGEKFDNTTAYLTYERFWHKQIDIKASFFGNYEVLYVQYPGLPPSPPSAPSSITVIDGGPNKGTMGKPFGVDVGRRYHKNGLSGSVIAIIVLSASIFVVLCSAVAWILIFKCTNRTSQPPTAPPASLSPIAKPAGIAGSMVGSGPSSVSLGSSIPPYTGSTKTFSSGEIEKATDNFDSERVIGEGGFGRVYSGVLEDGTKVAVKIIKRDDQQGGREFLAEVEMLSRLHHRNLVKLIGMCIEEHNRCLVYELIANGSVESHLHGVDSETSPLDWATRMKIALGAARGLAYLHEDSSPRVIHRDFKSSNILLEEDFTPKVSDFGLARSAMDDDDNHISTRVMGTFGYVAPEYAMTGHLLVKSDVYSYGVVLLELLTGKKPIDMSQPPGDENLVSLARPLLTSKDGLESIIDPSLGSNVSFDSIAKFSAIASMCVQPEVSHRPFMGEVVQALKLICNECDEINAESISRSQDYYSIDLDTRIDSESEHLPGTSQSQYVIADCDREVDVERGLSMSELFSRSAMHESESFRRHSSSGPLRTRRGKQFWQRFGRLSSRGSMSEHHGTALNS